MKYSVFITSHSSPDCCRTLDTLKRLHYTGNYFIVIDNEDDCIEQYIEKYRDNLLIFNKQEYINVSDSAHSIANAQRACVLYARNYIEDVAKLLGLDAFIMCDDDILNFSYRYLDDVSKQCKRTKVNDISEIIYAYLEYLLDADIACLGFGTANFYFGGYDSIASGDYLSRRAVSNFFFRNTKKQINWIMPMEDFNTAMRFGNYGELFLSPAFIQVEVAPQYTQKGGDSKLDGMAMFYKNTSSFTRAFYSTIIRPDCCVPKFWKEKWLPQMSKDNAYPKIINQCYRR